MDARLGHRVLGRPRDALVDGLLGVVLVVPLLVGGSTGAGARVAAAVVVAVAVATSRPAPMLSLLVAAGLSLLYLGGGADAVGVWPVVAMLVLGFLAGRREVQARPARIVFSSVAAAGLLLALATGAGWDWLLVLLVEAAAVLPWWLGRYLRLRTQLADAGWERAQRLESEKRGVAHQARLRERARIAQDMHDSLGHRLSLIALQAGGLELKADLDDSSRAAATQLRATAVDATDLLHDIIGLLHDVSEPTPDQPAVESITALVDRARAAGASVVLHHDGDPVDLPAAINQAAYRVVEETLTNALKHAPGAHVTVRLNSYPQETLVEITNALPPASQDAGNQGGGRGLIGMHERVRLAGGTLRAGPRDDHFSVVARLPSVVTDVEPPPTDQVPGWPQPVDDRRHAKREMRRDLRYTAALPLVLIMALALAFLGLRTYTTTSLALDPADFTRMQLGQSRTQLEAWLPPARMSESLPVVPEPPIPDGASCEYYRTSANPFNLSNDLYRLCFDEDRLVSKNLLVERP